MLACSLQMEICSATLIRPMAALHHVTYRNHALLPSALCDLTVFSGGTKPFLRIPVMYRGTAPELPMQLALLLGTAALPELVPAPPPSPERSHVPVHTPAMGLEGPTLVRRHDATDCIMSIDLNQPEDNKGDGSPRLKTGLTEWLVSAVCCSLGWHASTAGSLA